jgi:hypothetical protein
MAMASHTVNAGAECGERVGAEFLWPLWKSAPQPRLQRKLLIYVQKHSCKKTISASFLALASDKRGYYLLV